VVWFGIEEYYNFFKNWRISHQTPEKQNYQHSENALGCKRWRCPLGTRTKFKKTLFLLLSGKWSLGMKFVLQ